MPPTSDDLGPDSGLDPRQIVLDGAPDGVEMGMGIPVRKSLANCPGDGPVAWRTRSCGTNGAARRLGEIDQ